jgi:hypothetical protein
LNPVRPHEVGQKANVVNMLRERAVRIPGERWYEGTVSRRKVKAARSGS